MRAPRVRVTFLIFFCTAPFIRYRKKSKTRRGGAMRVLDFVTHVFFFVYIFYKNENRFKNIYKKQKKNNFLFLFLIFHVFSTTPYPLPPLPC